MSCSIYYLKTIIMCKHVNFDLILKYLKKGQKDWERKERFLDLIENFGIKTRYLKTWWTFKAFISFEYLLY